MSIRTTLLAVVVALFLLVPVTPVHAEPEAGVAVVIDPGHGGFDPGVTQYKLKEADVTLAISQKLREALEKRGIKALLTRETDSDHRPPGQRGRKARRADLDARLGMATNHQARVFVSLHINASPLASRGGAEVYYNKAPGAKELADSVQNSLQTLPNMSKREAKPGKDLYLLRHDDRPALIVECGYASIPQERARLVDPGYQAQLADKMAAAIEQYVKEASR
jgi:N-acetylmuramoyl-L-alanine amidase